MGLCVPLNMIFYKNYLVSYSILPKAYWGAIHNAWHIKKSPFQIMKYCEFLSPEAFHEGYKILYSTCKKSRKTQVLCFYLVDWWVCQVLHCIFKWLKCLFQTNPQDNLSLTGTEHYDSYWWYIQNLHVTFTFC